MHLLRVAAMRCRWWAVAWASIVLALSAGASPPPAPRILGTRPSGTNLLVSVQVPKGWPAALLESREQAESGAWVPRAVTRLPGRTVFKVPGYLTTHQLRIRGEAKEPLPRAFYRGKHQFGSRRSNLWRPGPGRGDVYSISASGVLSTMGTPTESTPAPRPVEEADIWKLCGDRLFFFNQLRGLQILNLSNPDAPVTQGTLDLPAVGEQLYLLDPQHVVLLVQDNCRGAGQSQVVLVDVSQSSPRVLHTLPVTGWIQESRLVGTALYVISQAYRAGTSTEEDQWGTLISAFDLAQPAAPISRAALWYPGQNHAVLATDRRLFLAADAASEDFQPVVRIIDISAPDGTLRDTAVIPTAGHVADKFKMHLAGDIFTVISEKTEWNAGADWTDTSVTVLETFCLTNARVPVALGCLEWAQGERLFTTRFAGTRAYVVTFEQVDPLWVVDLSDPAQPRLSGSVQVPGWSTYIEPMGDRLLTLGRETNRVAVSLFDVHDPARPVLLDRVPLGEQYSWSEANANEQALTVLADEGLILVPYEGDSASAWANSVQLIDLGTDSLQARGRIDHRLQPRRATAHANRLISLSGAELLSVDATDRDEPRITASHTLAWPANQVFVQGDYVLALATAGGSLATVPALRVVPAQQPDAVLTRFDLTNLPVVGATLHENRLYVLQSPRGTYWSPFGGLTATFDTNALLHTHLVLSILDVSALPAVSLLGQTEIPADDATDTGGSFQAVWPAPNLLVWFRAEESFWLRPLVGTKPGVVFDLGIAAASTAVASSPPSGAAAARAHGSQLSVNLISRWPYPSWWSPHGALLLAFDVSDPTHAALASRLSLEPTMAWGFSSAFTAQGKVYFSHAQSQVAGYYEDWQVSEHLNVIDYADPASPTVRPPVSLPARLAGVSADGALLYLLGTNPKRSGSTAPAVSACAYDGVSAYLVAALALPDTWPQPVLVNHGTLYLGRAAAAEGTNHWLEAWSLSAQGQFQRQVAARMAQPVSALAGFGQLLATQDTDNRLTLFDLSTPSSLRPCGQADPSGCLWFNLNRADGTLPSGLGLPLDDYGVRFIPVTQ